jgi:outer membrane protein TolC
MKRFVKLIILSLLVVVLLPSWVRAEEILGWQDCVKEAQKNHADLVSAQEVVKQAKADKMIATSAILPQINSQLSEVTSKPTSNSTSNTYAYGVSAQQLLFDGLKTPYDIAAAAKNVKAAQYNYEEISSNIRLRLRTAFISLINSQELLAITKDIAMRRKQNADLVKLLYEGGMEHRGALLTAQANLAQADFNVVQAGRAISVAQRQLSKEMGRAVVSPIRAVGNLEVLGVKREKPNFESLIARIPSLENLATKKEAAQFGLKSATAAFFPQIYANASAGRTDSSWPPHDDEWSAGVTISFPIFEGGRRLAEVSKAKAVLNQARADERSGRDGVMLTLEQAWTAWQNAIDTGAVQKEILRAAEEREKISRVQYTNGLLSFDNWTIIEDNLAQAQTTFLSAQANALIAEAQWIQAQGGTLDYAE